MKKTLVAVIAAMLAAATLPCFAKENVVTQWKVKQDGETAIFTFYSDKTFEFRALDENSNVLGEFEGTYSGDTTKDGKVSMVANGDTAICEIVDEDMLLLDNIPFTKVKK